MKSKKVPNINKFQQAFFFDPTTLLDRLLDEKFPIKNFVKVEIPKEESEASFSEGDYSEGDENFI